MEFFKRTSTHKQGGGGAAAVSHPAAATVSEAHSSLWSTGSMWLTANLRQT